MNDGDSKKQMERQTFTVEEALSPYKATVSRNLTPRERLARSDAMRLRLPNPQAVHDAKLFPKP